MKKKTKKSLSEILESLGFERIASETRVEMVRRLGSLAERLGMSKPTLAEIKKLERDRIGKFRPAPEIHLVFAFDERSRPWYADIKLMEKLENRGFVEEVLDMDKARELAQKLKDTLN